jgi:cobalt/nickel transport system ATP-binding protein
MDVTGSAIRLTNLNHRFADGRLVLDQLQLQIQAGERVALIGPNGAGKTTLFLRLCGVLPGRIGECLVLGYDPAHPDQARQLPRYIGIVFQNPDDQLFSSTVLEDVAFGPRNLGLSPADACTRAREALQQVGLTIHEDRPPYRLSGGEKRRAALAGVLAMKPGILLLDEPSMFLDPRGRRELIRAVTGLPGTVLIATHDLSLVLETCSRTIVLDQGRIVADGPSQDILSNQELMARHGLEWA